MNQNNSKKALWLIVWEYRWKIWPDNCKLRDYSDVGRIGGRFPTVAFVSLMFMLHKHRLEFKYSKHQHKWCFHAAWNVWWSCPCVVYIETFPEISVRCIVSTKQMCKLARKLILYAQLQNILHRSSKAAHLFLEKLSNIQLAWGLIADLYNSSDFDKIIAGEQYAVFWNDLIPRYPMYIVIYWIMIFLLVDGKMAKKNL